MLKKYFKLIVGLLVLTTVLAACNPSKSIQINPQVVDQSKLNIGIQMQKHRVEKQLQN